jgi:hypothetical protein
MPAIRHGPVSVSVRIILPSVRFQIVYMSSVLWAYGSCVVTVAAQCNHVYFATQIVLAQYVISYLQHSATLFGSTCFPEDTASD